MTEVIQTILMYFAGFVIILVVATLVFNIAVFLFNVMEDITDYYEPAEKKSYIVVDFGEFEYKPKCSLKKINNKESS